MQSENHIERKSSPDKPIPSGKNIMSAEIERYLWQPLRILSQRPSKLFRKKLVRLGFDLVSGKDSQPLTESQSHALNLQVEKAGNLLESLHLGSLIIDDIQDGSKDRRGGKSLHLEIGMPRALCAGNYLYFKALADLQKLGLTPQNELLMLKAFGDTMEKAHMGQMLDLSVKASTVSNSELPLLCEQIALLKTGCLTGFAVKLGAILAEASEEKQKIVYEFGLRYGVLLQNCDDLGNTTHKQNSTKRFEDLKQDKPTSLWTLIDKVYPKISKDLDSYSKCSSKNDSCFPAAELKRLVRDDHFNPIKVEEWFQKNELMAKTRSYLQQEILDLFSELKSKKLLSMSALAECQAMTEELLDAYTS